MLTWLNRDHTNKRARGGHRNGRADNPSHLQPKGSEDQRIENSPKIVSNRGLGQKALEFERAPHNRGGLKGWPLPASQVAPG
ncbi:hypothetical protein DVH24_042065 [Malus domestica]|uniref:Uncharacterized protein n=1 Tax=Malus domestica TaxID=3750 RepID=A0A498IT58_MALDO|nr:hypothetical protein DVH24_042065 [Malus domestica]